MDRSVFICFLILLISLISGSLFLTRSLHGSSQDKTASSRKQWASDVYVYPNPANKISTPNLHLDMNEDGPFTTRIYDISGTQLQEFEIPNGQTEVPLDISNFKSGIYVGVMSGSVNGMEPFMRRFSFTVVN